MNRAAGDSHSIFTPRQGQYLAFIHAYTLVNGRPPAEADMQRFFRVTPPSVYQMVLTLERDGLISRRPPRRCFITGSGFEPAIVRAHSRAMALSVMPGNSRRSSIAPASSPR